jgi:hypothetical protein
MDHPQRDRLEFLLELRMHSPLCDEDAEKLEGLEMFQSVGILDAESPVDFTYDVDYNTTSFPYDNPSYNDYYENSQSQAEQQHPVMSPLPMPTPEAARVHTQGPANIAATGFSHTYDTFHTDAAIIMPQAKKGPPPPGADGLRFNSFATASAAADLIFREPVQTVFDDVDEVEQNKRHHVKSLVDALRHDDYMPAPHEWADKENKVAPLTETQKAVWEKWQ